MMTASARAACAILASLVLVLAACGDDDDGAGSTPSTTVSSAPSTTAAEPTTTTAASGIRIERTVSGGVVEGDPGRESVPVGEEVTIVVTADVADEVHVHGYDLFGEVGPDAPAEVTFTADIPGVFEVELEGAGLLLLEIEVS